MIANECSVAALSLEITPEELFWGNLSGCMEAIDAGTTTILDHAHLNWSPNHSKPAIAGTITSGVRSVFAYTPTMLMESLKPIAFPKDAFPAWIMETLKTLSETKPLSDPNFRVQLGFAFDYYFLPEGMVKNYFAQAKACGVKLITSHYVRFGGEHSPALGELLHKYGLLDDNIVLSHAGGMPASEIKLLTDSNTYVSVTPNTEQAMNVGPSVCFNENLPGMFQRSSLGIDCHCATSSSIVNEMRTALQTARGVHAIQHKSCGMESETYHNAAEAFNLGTIHGARALNMQDQIGSIAVGKKADLILFDTLSPAMLCAAQRDPVMAIVLHSNIGDIDSVLVDGQFRKRDGKLLAVNKSNWDGDFEDGDKVEWKDVAKKLLGIQNRIIQRFPDLNLEELESTLRVRFTGH